MDPYRPPDSDTRKQLLEASFGKKGAAGGGLIDGCLIPTFYFQSSALVLRETGGPLTWPAIAILLGVIGTLVDGILGARRK
ncbi:MAG: hypothetical protein QNK82_03250 [Akkermansiaceae bacterium]|jgi:hypothetical protein